VRKKLQDFCLGSKVHKQGSPLKKEHFCNSIPTWGWMLRNGVVSKCGTSRSHDYHTSSLSNFTGNFGVGQVHVEITSLCSTNVIWIAVFGVFQWDKKNSPTHQWAFSSHFGPLFFWCLRRLGDSRSARRDGALRSTISPIHQDPPGSPGSSPCLRFKNVPSAALCV